MSEPSNGQRRHFTAEQKFRIVKEALTTDTSIADICRKYEIRDNVFYRWQQQFFDAALESFQNGKSGPTKAEQYKISKLELENQRMKNVIAEITAENIDFKKSLGE
jgi:transposase